jgi:hypothetical protein
MNKNDATIIYYTSNREDENFEKKIQKVLMRMNPGFPILSVSQKQIDFGENICVGDVGANDHNLYRQIQIACQSIFTPFVISAEADNLYPRDYFDIEPSKLDSIYRYSNVWILKHHRGYFFKKRWCEGAQIIGREYYLDLLEKELEGKPLWLNGHYPTNPFRNLNQNWNWYGTDIPVVSIKTGLGLRANTLTIAGETTRSLPYWGTTRVVRTKLGLV